MTEPKIFVFLLLVVIVSCQSLHHRALRLRRSEITEKEKRLPHDQCGKQKLETETQSIIWEIPPKRGEFPWIAAIGYRIKGEDPYKTSWLCAGSLITDQYVITAAHCLDENVLLRQKNGVRFQFVPAYVRLDELNLDPRVNDGAATRDYIIQSFIVHKGWSKYQLVNDLGLIKLREKVTFTDFVRPICLPPTNLRSPMFSEGDYPVVAGWGMTEKLTGSNELMRARVQIKNQESCRANLTAATQYRYYWLTELKIDTSVLCAEAKGKDSCKGDAGSPLMYYYEPEEGMSGGKHYLIGVKSYEFECTKEGYPGVYSLVSHHMPWILEHLDI